MSNRKLTPSMSMLVAFEAAARHQSFSRAGDELALTQSAVSRQIQALEEMLGVSLFQRSGRQVSLTELGALYARDIAPALARVRSACARVMAYGDRRSALHLAILPTFGINWLMPRLSDFYRQYPDLIIHLHTRNGEYNLDESGMDMAINVGVEPWPGLTAHRLVDEEMVLIASPALMRDRPIRQPADIPGYLLLQVDVRAEAWREWFIACQLPPHLMHLGPQFEMTQHMIQAVEAGIGIGLVARFLVEDKLREGTLVMPLNQRLPGNRGYYLLYPPEKAVIPAVQAFRDWLLPLAKGAWQIQGS